jgi:hypothetical protein
MQDQDEVDAVNAFNDANGLSARSKAVVEVSYANGAYGYRFRGTGFEANGDITVIGRKNHQVHFVLQAVACEGISHVEFPADGEQALRVAMDSTCPPCGAHNPQFDGKQTQAQVPNGRRDLLMFRDTMTSAGDFAYALTFEVERTDGTSDTPVCDPLVANRPY